MNKTKKFHTKFEWTDTFILILNSLIKQWSWEENKYETMLMLSGIVIIFLGMLMK